jgi:hypothetical protein
MGVAALGGKGLYSRWRASKVAAADHALPVASSAIPVSGEIHTFGWESPVRDAPPLGDGGNPRRGRSRGTAPTFNSIGLLRPVYTGTLLAVWAGSPRRRGRRPWRRGRADLIVYGRPFIANPDLVEPILPGTLSGLAGTSPSRARQPAQLRTLSTSCLSIGR